MLILLRMLRIYRSCSRYSIYSDRVNRVLGRVIEWGFLRFNIIYISFRFAVVVIARYIRGARVASAYLYITVMFCDVSVFMISIILDDIIFFRKDLDIMYLIINN